MSFYIVNHKPSNIININNLKPQDTQQKIYNVNQKKFLIDNERTTISLPKQSSSLEIVTISKSQRKNDDKFVHQQLKLENNLKLVHVGQQKDKIESHHQIVQQYRPQQQSDQQKSIYVMKNQLQQPIHSIQQTPQTNPTQENQKFIFVNQQQIKINNNEKERKEMLIKQLNFEMQKKEQIRLKDQEEKEELEKKKQLELQQQQIAEEKLKQLKLEELLKEEKLKQQQILLKQQQMEEKMRQQQEDQQKQLAQQVEQANREKLDTFSMIIKSQKDKQLPQPQRVLFASSSGTLILPRTNDEIQSTLREKVSLLLKKDAPRKKYYSRQWEEKEEVIHWGQRKLMVVETHFLTQWGHLSRNVIYVGAAPGQHIELLAQLFPSHDFYLYDPNEFRIEGGGNIGIYRKYFTDEEGLIFKQHLNGDYLLISDIRTADYRAMTSLENEEQILRDNKLQMRWVELIRPRKSMLKFRCAYPTQISQPTEFFSGQIMIQPWAPQSSTETRLIPDESLARCLYDNLVYEEQMFYHNDESRKSFHVPLESEELDGSWDACAEWLILSNYLKLTDGNQENLKREVDNLSHKITNYIQPDYGVRQLSDKKEKHQ